LKNFAVVGRNWKNAFTRSGTPFDIDGKKSKVAQLEEITAQTEFWNDSSTAQKTFGELNGLRRFLDHVNTIHEAVSDTGVMLDLVEEEQDTSHINEISRDLDHLLKELDRFEVMVLLNEKYDVNNAIVSLHAGAGGTEAQDWVQMLLRMYTRWAERWEYKVQVIDLLPGDEAGVKSATIMIQGENAYGFLKSEKGVHRLVRISPFDASRRRHTSFASVDVIPEIEDSIEINIDPGDLRVDTFRASGAGGQHVNKTDSAIRITHIPSGIVVECQSERSQHNNRETAMKVLRAKLFERQLLQQEQELADVRGEQQDIAWGSQIRSYVFQPYSLIKDHRTNVEIGNVNSVMDGGLDEFIYAYLRWKVLNKDGH
jgi:peptide chain release factor 2